LGCAQYDAGAAVDLGRELGARWIVTGGYQQTGERIRVTTALVDAAGGDTLAAEKIDGRWADIFEVQDRVVAAVLQTLEIGFDTISRQKPLTPETRSIAAYEHYVLGRQQMYEMQPRSLSVAIDHFERAIAIDPDYALAYSGLGTANALQFIRTSNPDHVVRAAGYLERAIEIDPELGEAYPWLSNIRIRKNDPAGSHEAGRKGVELQPDLAEAQYFCGGFSYMVPEFEPGSLRTAIWHLGEAIRLQPRFHAAWLVLGASTAFLGKHADAIRILTEAVRMESETNLVYRFVGARALLALAQMRMGSWEAARTWFLDSLEALRGTDHVYTSCFEAISICGLGENELRCSNENAAMSHFRRARRMIRESPRVSGGPRLAIRATARRITRETAGAAEDQRRRAVKLELPAAQQRHSCGSPSDRYAILFASVRSSLRE
jgi:tetratricopeptide (TPR) repeat protein